MECSLSGCKRSLYDLGFFICLVSFLLSFFSPFVWRRCGFSLPVDKPNWVVAVLLPETLDVIWTYASSQGTQWAQGRKHSKWLGELPYMARGNNVQVKWGPKEMMLRWRFSQTRGYHSLPSLPVPESSQQCMASVLCTTVLVTLLGCGAVWSSWPCTQLPKFLDLSLSWMVFFQCVYSVCCSLSIWTAPSLWLYSTDWCQPSFLDCGSEPQMGQVTNLATWICCSQNKTQSYT